MKVPENDVTSLLKRCREGDSAAPERLAEEVYGELQEIARRFLKSERKDHTLQATALVNEAWLRLAGSRRDSMPFEDRAHFLGAAATAMRRILVNHAERRRAEKRGGGRARVTLFEAASVFEETPEDLADLGDALARLEQADPRKGRIVELRFFGGLSEEEIARLLDVSVRTVEREWRFARAWLRREIEK